MKTPLRCFLVPLLPLLLFSGSASADEIDTVEIIGKRPPRMIPVKNAFPCIYWHAGYMFSAEEPRNLYVGSRSVLVELQQTSAKSHVLDSEGRYFDITGWEEIEPFGGMSLWFERLIGKAFMVPILINERRLTLDEFKATLLSVAEERFRHDVEPYALQDIRTGLPGAKSYLEAIRVAIKGT